MDSLRAATWLTLTCWEAVTTIEDEVAHIWPQPGRLTITKLLYFFSRYFPLAIQINNTVISGMISDRYPVPANICKLWLTYQTLATFLLLGAVDMILMVRVYAFYGRKQRIRILLGILLIVRVGLSSASAILTLPDQKFNDICLSERVPSLVIIFFLVGELIFQCIILGLTFAKQIMAIHEGWGRTPLVQLLCRDGTATFTVITGALIGMLIYAKFAYLHSSAHFVFPGMVAVMSSVGCRLIISMQKLVVTTHDAESSVTEGPELTTIIESLRTQTTPAQTLIHRSRSAASNQP
ncbi:hypothetical protein BJ165DRAFT_956207 [Panaeolus papilionaceus]|nr:hypothetical protein BJ165DRAFT_956207 [Panaeolus papilionaceus]